MIDEGDSGFSPDRKGQLRVLPMIEFENGFAKGWAFGVSSAFKAALDIKPTERVLSEKSLLRKQLENRGIVVSPDALSGDRRALGHLHQEMRQSGLVVMDISTTISNGKPKIIVALETEGSPPWYAFSQDDFLHDPPHAHELGWDQALRVLSRSVQIHDATPGWGDGPTEATRQGSRVTAILFRYRFEEVVVKERIALSQRALVSLLRYGDESGINPVEVA